IGPDGSVVKAKFPLATSIVDPTAEHYRPVVASDGTNFMTAWELPGRRQSGLVFSIDENIVRRRFDASGNPLTHDEFMTSGEDVESMSKTLGSVGEIVTTRPYAELGIAWVGDRYRITRLLRPGPSFTVYYGTTASTEPRITTRDIDSSGARILGTVGVLVN